MNSKVKYLKKVKKKKLNFNELYLNSHANVFIV